MPNVLSIRHVAFEDLGILEDIFTARGWSYRYHEAGTQDWATLNPLADDLVVVLGGAIAVYDTHLYPFITDELKFLEQRLAARKPTLGICLSAQMIAQALGARVYPAAFKEVGWSPLQLKVPGGIPRPVNGAQPSTPSLFIGTATPLSFPITLFSWHPRAAARIRYSFGMMLCWRFNVFPRARFVILKTGSSAMRLRSRLRPV